LRRLSVVAGTEWDAVLVQEVRSHVAAVLNHPSAEAVDPDRAFIEMGLDSLGAMELRNRLVHVSGLQLPATMVFDYPDPVAVARYLRTRIAGSEPVRGLYEGIEKIESILAAITASEQARTQVEGRLRLFSANLRSFLTPSSAADADLEITSDHELFAFFDKEFGSSDTA
jgi:acyl carrier protein